MGRQCYNPVLGDSSQGRAFVRLSAVLHDIRRHSVVLLEA